MAKEIKSFYITSLLVGAHYSFHFSVQQLITAKTPDALNIADKFTTYTALIDTQKALINPNASIAFTDELAEIDKERDALLAQVFRRIDMAADSPVEADRTAAALLLPIVAPYRGISANEYTKETAQITGMMRDLGIDEATDALDALTLGAYVQKVRQANNRFNQKYLERVQAEATRTKPTTNTKENRRLMDEAYADITKTINAYALTATTPVIDSFVDELNALIDLTRDIITRQQAGGTGNEKIEKRTRAAADKMGKALARMEESKRKYEADLAAYEKAKEEYEALI